LHRLSREEKQAKQRATHKQEEERIKLDDIVDYKNDTFQIKKKKGKSESLYLMHIVHKQFSEIKYVVLFHDLWSEFG
jgi:hypothetical protein